MIVAFMLGLLLLIVLCYALGRVAFAAVGLAVALLRVAARFVAWSW